MAGSLSVASTAVLSAQDAVVDSVVDGRSVVYSRYNKDPRTLHLGTPEFTGESSMYSVSAFTRKCLLSK
jgi:hypothetical protein